MKKYKTCEFLAFLFYCTSISIMLTYFGINKSTTLLYISITICYALSAYSNTFFKKYVKDKSKNIK